MNDHVAIGPRNASNRRSGWRLWLFRIALLLVSNLFVLGGIEFGARVLGFGYPIHFFDSNLVDGRSVITPNHRFFWSFFPRALSRSPQPFQFSESKTSKTKRIFLFGESAAMGDPEPAFGMSRILETLLNQRHPNEQYQVINLAVTAINSHVIRPIALEAGKLKSDFWCLYIGNNEVHGQFGPGTVFGQSEATLPLIRSSLAIKRTRIGQLANQFASALSGSSDSLDDWAGMSMFSGREVFLDDPRLESVYDNYRANLTEIVSAGSQSGAQVLLSNVAVNLRGSSPFQSQEPSQLNSAQREEWDRLFVEGKTLLESGLFQDALEPLSAASEVYDRYAEIHYLLGQCYWQLQDYRNAQAAFLRARDLDGLRFRTDTKLNQIAREVAEGAKSDRVHFVSGRDFVSYNAPNGIPGDELFWDHVHLRFPGNYLIALAFAREIESLQFTEEQISSFPTWVSLSDCAQALTLTRWSDYQMTQSMRQRLTEEPFRSQSVFSTRDGRLQEELQQHLVGISPEAFTGYQESFRKALKSAPQDYVRRDLFARYLFSQGRTSQAVTEWKTVTREVPSHLMAHYRIGNALAEDAKRAAEAEASLRKALAIRPATVNLLTALGIALATQDRDDEALDELEEALGLNPRSVEALIAKGKLLTKMGQATNAKATLEQASKLAPDSPAVKKALEEFGAR